MDNLQPKVKLRVYRRDYSDMTLLYNSKELDSIDKSFEYKPKIWIEKVEDGQEDKIAEKFEIDFRVDEINTAESQIGDKLLFIPYKQKCLQLNADDKYILTIVFYVQSTENIRNKDIQNFRFKVVIEPKGTLPDVEDNKKLFSETLGYSKRKRKWVKIGTSENKEIDENCLLVHDIKTHYLLEQILKAINKS